MISDINDYTIKSIEEYHSNNTTVFGITISFKRSLEGMTGILINYHAMCSMLVFVACIGFLIDPKDTNRLNLLVVLLLVVVSMLNVGQVND